MLAGIGDLFLVSDACQCVIDQLFVILCKEDRKDPDQAIDDKISDGGDDKVGEVGIPVEQVTAAHDKGIEQDAVKCYTQMPLKLCQVLLRQQKESG